MSIDIRLSRATVTKPRLEIRQHERQAKQIVSPGDVIGADATLMRGHGTFTSNDKLISSLAGCVERVNKLICVRPPKSMYIGEVGDVLVGKIVDVQQKRWKVDTNSRLHSLLLLSSVNLPGGELRRKTEEDELMMRSYLAEGDLVSAEVQSVFTDGSLSLHTRSLRYGKLGQGILVEVPPSLVRRSKTHFHDLPCGASVIIGNNGYIWICPTINDDTQHTGGYVQDMMEVSEGDYDVMSRLRNCILLLSEHNVSLYDTSILYAFEVSQQQQTCELMLPEVMSEVVMATRHRLLEETST